MNVFIIYALINCSVDPRKYVFFFLDGCHVTGIQLVNQVLLYAVVMLC